MRFCYFIDNHFALMLMLMSSRATTLADEYEDKYARNECIRQMRAARLKWLAWRKQGVSGPVEKHFLQAHLREALVFPRRPVGRAHSSPQAGGSRPEDRGCRKAKDKDKDKDKGKHKAKGKDDTDDTEGPVGCVCQRCVRRVVQVRNQLCIV
jgi:hypothetical protein